MERGSDKHGPRLDNAMEGESEPLTRSAKEAHVEGERDREAPADDPGGKGHRIAGSGSSADEHSWRDHGEQGGASHPKPKNG
jgi:hypothetical protein